MAAKSLRVLALLTGVACVLIGLYHLVLGIRSVPGEAASGITVDSRERFYNAIFAFYGLAWIWAARQSPMAISAIRFLAAAMLLGGIGRVISVIDVGWPHWFQTALIPVEFVVPIAVLLLASRVAGNRVSAPAPAALHS